MIASVAPAKPSRSQPSACSPTTSCSSSGHNITASALTLQYVPGENQTPPNIRLLNDGAITIGGPMALEGVGHVQLVLDPINADTIAALAPALVALRA